MRPHLDSVRETTSPGPRSPLWPRSVLTHSPAQRTHGGGALAETPNDGESARRDARRTRDGVPTANCAVVRPRVEPPAVCAQREAPARAMTETAQRPFAGVAGVRSRPPTGFDSPDLLQTSCCGGGNAPHWPSMTFKNAHAETVRQPPNSYFSVVTETRRNDGKTRSGRSSVKPLGHRKVQRVAAQAV